MAKEVRESLLPPNEADRVSALRRYQLLDTPTEESLNNIAHLVADVFEVPIALISLVDREQVFFKGNVGMTGVQATDRNVSLCSFAILSAAPTVFDKPLSEPCLLNNPLVHGEFGLRFYAAAPLLTADGFAIGSVCIIDKKERSFPKEKEAMLARFAATVMHQIELRLSAIKEKAIERQLLSKDKELRNIINTAPTPMFIFKGENMVIETANERALEVIRRTASVIGRPLLEAIPEIAGTDAYAAFQQVYRHGITKYGKEVLIPLEKDGKLEERYFNFVYTPIRENGQVVGVMDVAFEVTDQVNARKLVEESEERFRSLIEEAPMSTALFIGRELRIAVANKPMQASWGKGPEVVGKTLREAMPELEGQPFFAVLDRVYTTGETFHDAEAPAHVMVNGEMVTYYFNYTLKALRNAAGEVYGIINTNVNVTGQVLAQQKIAASEVRFRTLAEQAPVFVFESDAAANVVYWNERWLNFTGQTLEESLGRDGWPAVMHPDDLEGLTNTYMDAVAGQKPYEFEVRVRNKDGVYKNVLFTGIPRYKPDGSFDGYIGNGVDITAQIADKLALQASEAKLRGIITTAPAAIGLFVGRDLIIENPNQTFIDIVGKGWGVEGLPLREAMPELITEGQPFLNILDDVFTTGVPFISPASLVKIVQNGILTSRYYNISYSPVRDGNGEIYAILDVAIDVTELVEARRQLEEAQADLQGAIELAELGTWSIDAQTGLTTYSQRLQDWLGLERDEFKRSISSPTIDRADQERVRLAILRALQPTSSGKLDETYTIVNQQTGGKRIIHVTGKTSFDGDGKALVLSGTAQDVTVQQNLKLALEAEVAAQTEELARAVKDLAEANSKLKESNQQLIHSNEELSQYAYVASHDLQEPLRKIQFFTGMLAQADQDAQQRSGLIERITGSAKRMSLLINDLLSFSRLLSSEKLVRPVDLNSLVKDVVSDFELVINEKSAQVNVGLLPAVEGVSLQLNQLFSNLIGNALKFTSPGVKPIIEITCRKASAEEVAAQLPRPLNVRYNLITITDNGIGFDRVYVNQIFEVFKRLHGRSEYSGSGIGLAICRRVVMNHHGAIYADSIPQGGATFFILLPEKQSDEPAPATPAGFAWKQFDE